MSFLRVGIVGFGKIGALRFSYLKKMPNVAIVGILDPLLEKGSNSIPKNVLACNSLEELLALEIDAVFICATNDVLAEYTKKSLLSGKHVFCEKPPARTTAELISVKEVEARCSKVLKYGFNHRYHYSVMEAKKIIDSGAMGKMLWLRGVYGKAGSIDFHKNWRNYRKYSGGGILIDQGIHMLDLMRYLSGQEFTHINSFVTNSFWDIEAEDNAFVIMQSPKKITAMMHSSATQWRHKFLLEMAFEEGYLNLDGILSGTHSYAPEKLIIGRREFEDITFAMGKPRETIISFENDDSWTIEIDEFIAATNGNGVVSNGTSDDALKTLELVERIYENSGFYSDK